MSLSSLRLLQVGLARFSLRPIWDGVLARALDSLPSPGLKIPLLPFKGILAPTSLGTAPVQAAFVWAWLARCPATVISPDENLPSSRPYPS